MPKSNQMTLWLELSSALAIDLKPNEVDIESTFAMKAEEFASLVDRESERVNEALLSMALAKGQEEVHAIMDALSPDTVIVLYSRWSHYFGRWKQITDPCPCPWMQADQKDIWRAILLAMADEGPAVKAARRHLWPAWF